MFHDADIYERPEDFWPDRWLLSEFGTKPGVDDTDRRNNIWFGSGRRFCPGVHLATNSLVREMVFHAGVGLRFKIDDQHHELDLGFRFWTRDRPEN